MFSIVLIGGSPPIIGCGEPVAQYAPARVLPEPHY
jgi:hypothetical protein